MLGIPGEDYLKFKQWSDALVAVASFGNKMQDRSKSIDEMMAYFGKMAAMRRTKRAEDLVTALVEADIEGEKLEEWEVLGFCMLLLVAGNETTTNLLSNLVSLLAGRDDLWQRLREDRTLVDAAIDESLRHESPVQFLVRFTTRDVEVSGITIGQGMPVSVSFGAANRDPAAFERPDEFLLDRNLSNHVAFGAGIHFCLGAPLAKVEARVSLNALLDRFERIEKGAGPGVRQRESNLLLGFSKLPLRLVA